MSEYITEFERPLPKGTVVVNANGDKRTIEKDSTNNSVVWFDGFLGPKLWPPGGTNYRVVSIPAQEQEIIIDGIKVDTHEKDPHGIDQHVPGAKLDSGKIMAGVLGDFSLALQAVAEVGTHGAEKYTRGGWQHVPNGVERYTDAMWRHLLYERHDAFDADSGLLHAQHLAWNALARLELMLREKSTQIKPTSAELASNVKNLIADAIGHHPV